MKDDLTYYMKSISGFPLITREEENELAVKIQDGCEESFDKLFYSNLRLVVTIAMKYKNPQVDFYALNKPVFVRLFRRNYRALTTTTV